MSHPYQSHREKHPGQKKARERVKGYASGGAVTAEPKATGGAAKASVQELKVGGAAGGARLDKFARGGKAKGRGKKNHTHININVAPKGPDAAPPIMPPPAMDAAGPPPGGPMGAPTGGPPGGAPMGQPLPPPMKRGGKVNVKGGGESGVGRLDKCKAYGLKAKG